MIKPFKYQCATCGKIHEGSPSFSFEAPAYYEKKASVFSELISKNYLDSDFCRTNKFFFIRVVLEIPIIGAQEPFTWGVWISQSWENYHYYRKHFLENLEGKETFGWLSNALPHYENTLGLKTVAIFQNNGKRPKLCLQKTNHELSLDFHEGIPIKKANQIASIAQHYEESLSVEV